MHQDRVFANRLASWEAEQLEKSGWFIHFVAGDPDRSIAPNYHTHGLVETYQHPDLQIVVPLDTKTLYHIFHTIVDEIKQGSHYVPGRDYSGILRGYDVRFVVAEEGNRELYRVILPDAHGNLDRESIQGSFLHQYDDI